MKIKTKIHLLLTSGALIVLLVGGVMLSAERDITAHQRAIQSSEQLIRSAAELRLLTVETLLYHEARSIDQWQRKIVRFQADLQVLERERPAARATVARIRKNIESADAIHIALRSQSQSPSQSPSADQTTPASAAQDAAFAARNFSALTLVIQDVIDGVSELSRARRSEELQTWRTIRMAVGLMLVAMLVQLAFTWRLTQGSILQPLATLVRATGRIAAGDYSFRLNLPQGDEIGTLAGAFNAMSMQVERSNQAMRLEQENLAITLDSIADAVIATDAQGLITRMNPVAERLTGWPLAEALGLPLNDVFHIRSAETRLRSVNPVQLVMAHGVLVGQTGQTVLLARDGPEYQIATSAAPIRDVADTIVGVVLVFSDVTEKYHADEAIKLALREKTALLRELHHRVKNNLQVITSLLRLEGFRTENEATQVVLSEMQGRIRAMALLHETIYRKDSFAAIDLGDYITQIAEESLGTLLLNPGAVQLHLALAALQVGLDQAMPCGLLMSELMSNCLKHGFPDGRGGKIAISLQPLNEARRWRLVVSDNGVGLPADFADKQGKSLGLQLVGDLAVQMGGTLHIGAGPQAVFTVEFSAEVVTSIHAALATGNLATANLATGNDQVEQ